MDISFSGKLVFSCPIIQSRCHYSLFEAALALKVDYKLLPLWSRANALDKKPITITMMPVKMKFIGYFFVE